MRKALARKTRRYFYHRNFRFLPHTYLKLDGKHTMEPSGPILHATCGKPIYKMKNYFFFLYFSLTAPTPRSSSSSSFLTSIEEKFKLQFPNQFQTEFHSEATVGFR